MLNVLGFSRPSITPPGASNVLDLVGGCGRGGGGEDQSLPSVEKLLLGAGGA